MSDTPSSLPRVDPRKLLYFATVIESGSLNRAARALAVSQPALSTSMDRLEAEVGTKLLERGPQGVVATKMGDILYCHARLIRDEIGLALRNLGSSPESRSHALRLGSLPSLASKIVPLALGLWRERNRDATVEVVENAQFDLLTGLLRRDFDVVIGYTNVFDMVDGLRQRVLFRDTLQVIASSAHPIRELPNPGWTDLVQYPWISPTSRRTHTVLDQIIQTTDARMPHVTVCGSVSLLKSLVAETDHLALLPAHAVNTETADARLAPIEFYDPALDRDIAVFFREGFVLDGPCKDLIACVARTGSELCQPTQSPAAND